MLSDTWEGMLSDTGRAGALFHVRQSDWALAGHTQKGGALSSLHELAMRGNSVLPRESLSPDSPFSPRERSQRLGINQDVVFVWLDPQAQKARWLGRCRISAS